MIAYSLLKQCRAQTDKLVTWFWFTRLRCYYYV